MTGSPELIAPPRRRCRVARIEDVIERARPGRRDRRRGRDPGADRSASSASRAAANGCRAPAPAMVEPPVTVAPSGAAAHHEHAHRRLRLDAVLYALGATLRIQRSNQRRRRSKKSSARLPSTGAAAAEIDLAGIAQRAVAMRPRPEDQALRAAPGSRQADDSSRSRCARTGRTSPTDARPATSA